MRFEPAALPGIVLIRPVRHGDARGAFLESWREDRFDEAGIPARFVQDNQSWSAKAGTVRGLHFQRPPRAQAKLVRAVAGRIRDVVVDLRRSSPGFGRHLAVELDAAEGTAIFVPEGFAHGFCTLTDDCVVAYRCSDYYAPEAEGGICWNDPALGIDWPVGEADAVLSDRDRRWPALAALGEVFP